MKNFFLGFFACAVCVIVGILLWPSPAPPDPVVTINDPSDHDIDLDVASSGSLIGQITIADGQTGPETDNQSTGGVSPEFTPLQPLTAHVPVSGSIDVVITDKHAGKELDRETHPIEGVTDVTFDGQELTVKTEFTDRMVIGIDLPDTKNRIGVEYDGEWSAYYRRDLVEIGPVQIWAEVATDGFTAGAEWRF